MLKKELIEEIELILRTNKNNKYCDIEQLKYLLTEIIEEHNYVKSC